jgi:DNA repair photolyase
MSSVADPSSNQSDASSPAAQEQASKARPRAEEAPLSKRQADGRNSPHGRGAGRRMANRFNRTQRVREHEEGLDDPNPPPCQTVFHKEHAKQVVNRVASPDVGMSWSLNPYQGCEHGCAYCYARPTHSYWGWGPGLDFEQQIHVKENAPAQLEALFRKPDWEPEPIVLSGNTDCYQPAERHYRITRALLEVFLRYQHPVGIITKNSLVLRDLDLLEALAEQGLVRVLVSLTSLREGLRRRLEPRTASGKRRLQVMSALKEAGVPVQAMLAPIIPALNDVELADLVEHAAAAGAENVHMQVLRLNGPVEEVFSEWLEAHYPKRKQAVLRGVRALHGGKLGNSRFGERMRGKGPEAEALRQWFRILKRKHFGDPDPDPLRCDAFRRPGGRQMQLFGGT